MSDRELFEHSRRLREKVRQLLEESRTLMVLLHQRNAAARRDRALQHSSADEDEGASR
ncbi:hypothetical protein [Azospirillum canadense]|uniref:hypothetical protein n=1 Tax=Azospirillum canadense TaxID=403962 RepID=UPI002226DE21|nr:hypothetical protein [Azospirillum canadense]MCW2237467.1 hypothetical protein [Azospirillum canadense]